MHKRGSFYDVVSVGNCKIVDEDYRAVLKITLDFFKDKNLSFYHRLRHVGYLRHLLVRKAVKTGEILIALVTTTQREEFVKIEDINIEEIEYLLRVVRYGLLVFLTMGVYPFVFKMKKIF